CRSPTRSQVCRENGRVSRTVPVLRARRRRPRLGRQYSAGCANQRYAVCVPDEETDELVHPALVRASGPLSGRPMKVMTKWSYYYTDRPVRATAKPNAQVALHGYPWPPWLFSTAHRHIGLKSGSHRHPTKVGCQQDERAVTFLIRQRPPR